MRGAPALCDAGTVRNYHIVELDQPRDDAPGAILTAFQGVEALERDFDLARHGNDDQTDPAAAMLSQYRPSSDSEYVWLLAIAGDAPAGSTTGRFGLLVLRPDDALVPTDVVGAVNFALPLRDNRDAVQDIMMHVRPQWRRHGIGHALQTAVEQVAALRGRTVLQGYSDARASQAADALHPARGPFAIEPDEGTAFALAMGYQLAQAERHSVQDLTAYDFAAPVSPDGYRIETWTGRTPEPLRTHMAEMLRVMSMAAPAGDFHFEEEIWDAARVSAMDDEVLDAREAIVSLAIHERTGEAAGLSQLYRTIGKPAVVDQWNTVVAAGHRGHSLGLVLKQANLVRLADVWPEARRVHTWNATENDYMWAINERLGYRTENIDAGWQKRL
ncbi:hypothetical protein GCM10009785_05510 [Brooklawnia cerclae]